MVTPQQAAIMTLAVLTVIALLSACTVMCGAGVHERSHEVRVRTCMCITPERMGRGPVLMPWSVRGHSTRAPRQRGFRASDLSRSDPLYLRVHARTMRAERSTC